MKQTLLCLLVICVTIFSSVSQSFAQNDGELFYIPSDNTDERVENANRHKLDYVNITQWHESGYTGKGVKILLADSGKVWQDFPVFNNKVVVLQEDSLSDKPVNSHAMSSAQMLHLIAPDAEIYVGSFPDVIEAINYGYQIVSSSNSSTVEVMEQYAKRYDNQYQRAYEQGIFMNNSIGNEGNLYYNGWAESPYWWSTGAVRKGWGSDLVSRTAYSSVSEYLKSMAFTELHYYHFNNSDRYVSSFPYGGTSASSPVLSGMVALYYQYHREQNGEFPTVEETRQFIIDNSIDLEEEGHDQYTGHGLFVLPKLEKINVEKCNITPEDSNEYAVEMIRPDLELRYVHIDFVDEYINDKGYALTKCN